MLFCNAPHPLAPSPQGEGENIPTAFEYRPIAQSRNLQAIAKAVDTIEKM